MLEQTVLVAAGSRPRPAAGAPQPRHVQRVELPHCPAADPQPRHTVGPRQAPARGWKAG